MPYRYHCISALDKVNGVFRTNSGMPARVLRADAMRFAYKDPFDPVTGAYAGLPDTLDLWSEVTAPGRYFDPHNPFGPGGFTYVEIYDPEYWMTAKGYSSQSCFHPIYRMKSVNNLSPVSNTTIAVWVTKYEDIVPDVVSGPAVPARSVHFGFPLWFFERDDVDAIVDVIFDEWQIRAGP
jgi:hypothetical protein